jgi:branched-subunit amino acid ABC-type transport system permease component
MQTLYDFFVGPFVEIYQFPVFFLEVVIGGMSAGIMYALVAVGFAVIFRASGVVNFAQGDIGALPAMFVVLLVIQSGFNYYLGALIGLAAAIVL